MEYFVEQATTHREAEAKVRAKYGEHARIMHHRTVRMGGFLGLFSHEGVEVTGYFSNEPRRKAPEKDLEAEKKKLIEAARGTNEKADSGIDSVLEEIRSLKDSLLEVNREQASHPNILKARRVLEENDFSPPYTNRMIDRIRSEMPVEQLDDEETVLSTVLGWIADSIKLHVPRSTGRPEMFVLVGPTGVGKTTTIAKLAAMYGIDPYGSRKRDIRVLTIDNYRIGARQQIETYCQIMGIPVSFVESAEDMKKQLALAAECDMVFIDTIGKSPRDFRRLGEMNELLSICGPRARVHLALSATTKTVDVAEIATQFEPFKYEAVVITKLDETTRAGNVISILSDRDKPISFTTNGQRVPQDIERATVLELLLHLEGFGVSREQLEQTYGSATVRSA